MDRKNVQENFTELLRIIKTLRGPDGCPWDRKQTHHSLIPYILEEAHEVVAAVEDNKPDELAGELGDVLLQVVLHAEIASERIDQGLDDGFNMSTVLNAICTKLIHRHPHVFGTVKVDSSEQVIENWQRLKIAEKDSLPETILLDSVSCSLPQLIVAQKYQERAAQAGFDWDNIGDVLDKVKEEFQEVNLELEKSNSAHVEEELGDLLFAVVNLCRFLKVNGEEALRKANRKFKRRFTAVEKTIGGIEKMKQKSLEELDLVWDAVKQTEQKKSD